MAVVTSGKNTAYLDLLRAVAIVLVVNSHPDDLYPIPQLGTGGMFGNELFFFVSGYGLFLSYNKSHEPIGGWRIRRIVRVYGPLFVVATVLVLIGDIQIHTAIDRIPALAFLVFAFRLARHPWLDKFVADHLSGVVALLAGMSLQIYLIHEYVLHLETLRAIAFPANFVVFALATLSLSVLFGKINFGQQSKGRGVRHPAGSVAVSQADSSISMPATAAVPPPR